jgi:hypothetical protein
MAFGVVVIAALVGSPGLGQSVLNGLEKVNVGLALDAGLAIVLVAVILDRISTGAVLPSRHSHGVPLEGRRRTAKRDPMTVSERQVPGPAIDALLTHAERFPADGFAAPPGPVNCWSTGSRPMSATACRSSGYLVDQRLPRHPHARAAAPAADRHAVVDVTAAIGTLALITAGRRAAIISVGCLVAIGGLRSGTSMDT